MSQVKEVNGLKGSGSQGGRVDMNGLRKLGDQLKGQAGRGRHCTGL